MKLSEYMRASEEVFLDLTALEDYLVPTLHHIVEKIDVSDLAAFVSDLLSLANLWRINEEDKVKSDRVRRLVSMLASCLLVDYLNCHAEIIRELMQVPVPIIPDQGAPPA